MGTESGRWAVFTQTIDGNIQFLTWCALPIMSTLGTFILFKKMSGKIF